MSETWEEQKARWDREAAAKKVKDQKAWDEKYSKLKPIDTYVDDEGRHWSATFLDSVKETDTEVHTKTTRFTFYEGYKVEHKYTGTSKVQKFFAVGGKFDGTKVTEEKAGDSYQLYNCGSRHSGTPHVILVHKGAFK